MGRPCVFSGRPATGVANDWITYIHLHDAQGERIAQFDGPPLDGLQSTGQWHTNALYIDRRQLNLPAGLAPGTYLLRVGALQFRQRREAAFPA